MKVNLITEKNATYTVNWKEIIFVLIAVGLVLVLFWNYYININKVKYMESELSELDNQLNMMLNKKSEYVELSKEINQLEKRQDYINSLTYDWDIVVEEMGYLIPERAVLKYIQIDKNRFSTGGTAINNKEVVKLINAMKVSPIFTDIKLNKLEQAENATFQLEAQIVKEGG